MEIQGKVIAVLAPREGTSKTGNPWKVQEYVIETEEQYPKKMCFEVFGNDRISQFASMLVVGNTVKVSFDIDARQWNDRWFNSIRAWKVELPMQEPMAEIPQQAIPEWRRQAAATCSPVCSPHSSHEATTRKTPV